MNKEKVLKLLRAISNWSVNLQTSLKSTGKQIDPEEKEVLLSLSCLIIKKAKAVHQSLGSENNIMDSSRLSSNQKNLEEEIERLTKVNLDLESANKLAKAEFREVKAEIENVKSYYQSLGEIERIRSEELEEQVTHLRRIIEDQEEQVNNYSIQVVESNRQIEQLQETVAELEVTIAENNKEILELKQQVIATKNPEA